MVEHPVMLIYQLSFDYSPQKYSYQEADVEMIFEDDKERQQYEEDMRMAKQLQEEEDEEEDRRYGTSKKKNGKLSSFYPSRDKQNPEVDIEIDQKDIMIDQKDIKIGQKVEEDKEEVIDTSTNKHVPLDEVKEVSKDVQMGLEDGQWQCKKWTLFNKMPDYRCTACETLDDHAFDEFYKK